MNERITVERYNADNLVQWLWEFVYMDGTLWLNSYEELTRPSKRHKFRTSLFYARLNDRDSTLKEIDVVLPHDVIQEAIKKFTEGVTVKRWSERYPLRNAPAKWWDNNVTLESLEGNDDVSMRV